MNNSSVFVVIPNWNIKKDLGECIESLRQAGIDDRSIVVVDNASTDGSPEFIREVYPDVVLIALRENKGYAGALNVGIRHAMTRQPDFVFALNNDTVVLPDTISQLVRRMQERPDIGIISPKVLYYSHPNRLFSLGAKSYRFLPVTVEYGHRWQDNGRHRNVEEFDYVTGCAMFIRADLFKDVGLFDESYFMYYEDLDYCRRVRDKGIRIAFDGSAVIYHKASLSSKKQGSRIIYVRARNKVWFYRRYPHGPSTWMTKMVLWIMAFWYALSKLAAGQAENAKAYWSGFLNGWQDPLPPICGTLLTEDA